MEKFVKILAIITGILMLLAGVAFLIFGRSLFAVSTVAVTVTPTPKGHLVQVNTATPKPAATPTPSPTPTLTPTLTNTPSPLPTPTHDPVRTVEDRVWTVRDAELRVDANNEGIKLAVIPIRTGVRRTGIHENGYSRVEYDGFTGFVSDSDIMTAEPTATASPTPTSSPSPTPWVINNLTVKDGIKEIYDDPNYWRGDGEKETGYRVYTHKRTYLMEEPRSDSKRLAFFPERTVLYVYALCENGWLLVDDRESISEYYGYVDPSAVSTVVPTSTPRPTATMTPSPRPTATLYPEVTGYVTKTETVHENGCSTEKTSYSDGSTVEVRHVDGTDIVVTATTYKDGTCVERSNEDDYTLINHPDGSWTFVNDDGTTDFWGADGKLKFIVERFYESYYNLTIFFRYKTSSSRNSAVICNSDGTDNKWSGTVYHFNGMVLGGPKRLISIYDENGVLHEIPIADGPFYDY